MEKRIRIFVDEETLGKIIDLMAKSHDSKLALLSAKWENEYFAEDEEKTEEHPEDKYAQVA